MSSPSEIGRIKPSWEMTWKGKVHPYVRTTQRQKWVDKRYKSYQAFKRVFRASASSQGIPEGLESGKRYWLSIAVRVTGNLRADLDNLIKSCGDSLWTQDNRIKTIWASVEENSYEDSCSLALYEM